MQRLLQMSSHCHHLLLGSLLWQPISVQHNLPRCCMLTVMLLYNSTCASQEGLDNCWCLINAGGVHYSAMSRGHAYAEHQHGTDTL